METMTIDYEGGMKFRAHARQHDIISDQPPGKGEDTGPTPPELLIASLGTCIGVYAKFFAQRHDISLEGMKIEMEWGRAENPTRVGEIRARITLPAGIPENYRQGILKSAASCLIHNTLTHSSGIEITLAE